MSNARIQTFLRYPGSKRRMLGFLERHLPTRADLHGRLIEPFVGGAAIFFLVHPKKAILADANLELIELYKGIKKSPDGVWRIYRDYPSTKRGYHVVRATDRDSLSLVRKAARSLYLNRTCFKGMWRQNARGQFNIGYGGQDRRWSIVPRDLRAVSKRLKTAALQNADFEEIISLANSEDFVFVDPPYRPGEREQTNAHYGSKQFSFNDHKRLASTLIAADRKGIRWSLTISSHRDILKLYRGFSRNAIPMATSSRIGILTADSGEVLISNH